MIQVSNLEKAYAGHIIFDNTGFTVNSGERVGLVGRNGHGKTTLLRMILGEERPDSGIINIPNNYTIGHLSQHIRFTEDTVLKEGCLSLKPAEDGRDETYRVETILSGLGFSSNDLVLNPMELSGGYQIRLNLAKVLVQEPNLLLLDEPTNYLDIVSIRWLTKFLQRWKDEMILITHDRDFMDSVTTHTMAIHRCKIRKIKGAVQKLYEQILLEEEVYEQTRVNEEKKRSETEQFINRFRAQANRASAVQSRIKALQRKEKLEKISKIKNLDFEFNSAPFTGKLLVEAENISFAFAPAGAALINGLSLSIGKNDRIAIIGKNGNGKTTLLNLLAGELSPLRGAVNHSPRLKLAYFGQTNINRLNLQKTVEEEIMDVLPEYNRRRARNICGSMMFEGDKALKKVEVLSGGEKSRVLLGKLLATPANLLLLDEPTNHLDMESIDSLIEAIEVFEGAVIVVTHSERMLHAIATRLIVFDDGKVNVFEGTYQEFLDRLGWKNEFEIENDKCNGKKNAQAKGANRKDMRRIRAELITDRSKTLGALQGRLTEVENTITELEQQIEKTTHALLEASVKGEGAAIKTMSKSLHDSKAKIDILFNEMDNLTLELDAKSREFEEKLNELSGDVNMPA
jgi:ATP-binding cassette subfamily F protein 3